MNWKIFIMYRETDNQKRFQIYKLCRAGRFLKWRLLLLEELPRERMIKKFKFLKKKIASSQN